MPEKQLRDIGARDREMYEKGNQAFQKNNLDYALTLYTQVLTNEPGFLDCRVALRSLQMKKTGASSGGLFKKFLGNASASPQLAKAQLLIRNNPAEAILALEQVLNGDPNNLSAHKTMAEAAMMLDLPRTAVLSLEIAYKAAPKDREVAERLAKALSSMGNPQRAERIYKDLLQTYPNDPDLEQSLKNVVASRTMQEGGYDGIENGEGSYRDILRNKEQSVSLEQEKREIKDDDVAGRLITEYEARLKTEPENMRLIRSIAELYSQKKEYERALHYYQQIQASAQGNDATLDKAVSELRARQLDHKSSQLDQSAADYHEQAAEIRKAKDDLLLESAKSRVEKNPNDLTFRYELGELLFKTGRISEAIQEFQKSQQNPNRRVPSMGYLGKCFARRNMNDLAARTFQNALKEKVLFDEEKKDLIYHLAGVLEKQSKTEDAIEQLKLIYEVDIGFRDVAERVDAYYSAQG